MGFTSHDKDLLIDGVNYESRGGFNPTAVETSRDMSVDNMDIDGVIDSDRITKQDIVSGRYDNATLLVFMCNWKNLSDEPYIIRRGTIGQVKTGKTAFTAEVRGLLQAYQQQTGEIYQKTCRATLGDSKCQKDRTSFTFTGEVTEVNVNGSFNTTLTNADKFFDYGLITFTSGDNDGRPYDVKQFTYEDGCVTTFLPTTFAVAVGDEFTAIAGCDGNRSTCKIKFNNIINFRGEPDVPGSDYSTSYPYQGSSNTVSEGQSAKR
jgi:uncharacterized phage protein (TIGR02218 family)